LELRLPGENLRRFFSRFSDSQIREFLAGLPMLAVERDLPTGRPSHGVEG
jgi:hypothetical protein